MDSGRRGSAPLHTPFFISLLVLRIMAVESACRFGHNTALLRTSRESAHAIRIVARLAAYAVLLSAVVSLLTSNVAAALTAGSFAGLVAGMATQTVMGNMVAGVFLAIARPIRIGDNVTVAGNTGVVLNTTLMHLVLQTEDREFLIPSSNVVTAVLTRYRKSEN